MPMFIYIYFCDDGANCQVPSVRETALKYHTTKLKCEGIISSDGEKH